MSEGPDRPLYLYRLVPTAAPDYPRWDNAPSHGEVLVRAHSPADARITAAEAELDFTEIDAKPAEGTDTRMASAFRDEKLYTVIEAGEECGFAAAGARGVVQGLVRVDTIKPTQV
ncbi:hypothetical protein BJF92_06410 [Rhizobium rhizosphaerae]|uniref:Uncharacterized protein n=1 Tax=Xaviernesmea rhizosphaerae TaxID=1672749 RepID=A0A1Q9API8_9HYPH|nr:hypothetical protein [Xaviernesmea rhizosphaerae]OLP57275.1 hypothetical protein BJF92_06410 [Xaviernesmea rhizosphaerae]